jgi:hypothetical protein
MTSSFRSGIRAGVPVALPITLIAMAITALTRIVV